MSTNIKNGVEYGCHVELDFGEKPDDCVLDLGENEYCMFATLESGRPRRSKWTCEYWKKIKEVKP